MAQPPRWPRNRSRRRWRSNWRRRWRPASWTASPPRIRPTPGVYIGALYIPNFQLLVIANSYAAPTLLDTRLTKKEYRDVYIDLNSATTAATRLFVEDLGADGVKAKREDNQGFDAVENNGSRTIFDGDWKKQKMSEEDYMKAFAAADERYAQVLTALAGAAEAGLVRIPLPRPEAMPG